MKISCFADSIQLLLLFRSSNNSADEQKRKKDFAKNLLFVTHILHNDWLGSTGKHNENDNKYKKKTFVQSVVVSPICTGEFMSS